MAACSTSRSLARVAPYRHAPQHRIALPRSSVRASSFLTDAINSFSVAVKNSPLNEGKKALAVAQAGEYDAAATKAMIEELTTSNPVVVFSFSTCPFCVKAKAQLDELGVKYKALELNQMDKQGLAIRAELAKMTDRTSMPNVFIGGKSVGGCNDGPGVIPLQKEGKLVPMLREAGALA